MNAHNAALTAHWPEITRYARSFVGRRPWLDVDDMTQVAALGFWRGLQTWEAGEGGLPLLPYCLYRAQRFLQTAYRNHARGWAREHRTLGAMTFPTSETPDLALRVHMARPQPPVDLGRTQRLFDRGW